MSPFHLPVGTQIMAFISLPAVGSNCLGTPREASSLYRASISPGSRGVQAIRVWRMGPLSTVTCLRTASSACRTSAEPSSLQSMTVAALRTFSLLSSSAFSSRGSSAGLSPVPMAQTNSARRSAACFLSVSGVRNSRLSRGSWARRRR